MPFPGARVGDSLTHGPPIVGVPCATVHIGGKPAWRVGDQHTCSVPNAPPPAGPGTPHGPGTTGPPGSVTVLVGGKPAARVSDKIIEPGAVQPPMTMNPIVMGATTVLIK